MTNDSNVTTDSIFCDGASLTCDVDDLLPGRPYKFTLMACFNSEGDDEICGEESEPMVDWTQPLSKFFLTHFPRLFVDNSLLFSFFAYQDLSRSISVRFRVVKLRFALIPLPMEVK